MMPPSTETTRRLRRACGPAAVTLGRWLVVFAAAHHSVGAVAEAQPASGADTRAMLDRYCVSCHSERLQSGGLALDDVDAGRP
ncbi:MAG TPA: hypothetical protein DEQ98_14245, partial [Acidobacteria bacterium]|nr:hypothetical protein [Acidobacteriota bacterium]